MKTANKLTSYTPTHPGEVIKDEIEYRGISQKQLSEQIGVPYTMLNEILNGKRPVTPTIAILLEAALGIDAEIFVNMQTRYKVSITAIITQTIKPTPKIRAK